MAVTYADVATLAGTSTAVVSYVFNDGPRNVAPETKARVLEAARALGYRPNRLAASLRSGSTGFVGVLAPDSSIPFFAELTRALISELGEQGHLALVSHAGISGMNEVATIEALLSARVEGLLVTAFWNEEHLEVDVNVPVVYVHHRPASSSSPLIPSDNVHATKLAVDHMKSHGIAPAFWTGPDDEGPLGERTQTWREAVGELAAEPFRSNYDAAEAARVFLQVVASGEVPRGIVCATDQQAFGILAGAYEAGIRVPEQLAVISLDGSPETAFTAPPLTTVKQPIRAMVKAAVATLTNTQPLGEQFRGDLIIRRSCGC